MEEIFEGAAMKRPLRWLPLWAGLLMAMAVPVAHAGPMGFKESVMSMGDFGANWREGFANYAFTAQDAIGLGGLWMRSDDGLRVREVAEVNYTRRLARWNLPDAQANVWLIAGLGPVTGNDFSGSRTLFSPGIQLDYETTRVYLAATARLYRADAPTDRLLCWLHGGPTDQWQVTFMPRIAFWRSQGWNVLVPDHRGSTGHGRAYQQALRGRWGELDVSDTIDAITHAHAHAWGRADVEPDQVHGDNRERATHAVEDPITLAVGGAEAVAGRLRVRVAHRDQHRRALVLIVRIVRAADRTIKIKRRQVREVAQRQD